MVMGDTVARPGGDAAIVRIHGGNRGLAITTDCTPRYVAADPYRGGMQAVAEAWRNLTAVGATPLATTDCLNFGNPEREDVMGTFVGAVKGLGDACRALEFPVVSGNVSLYNETNGNAVQPTPNIGGVGLIEDLDRVATAALNKDDQTLILIGDTLGHLGASIYLRELCGSEEGAPPPVDPAIERRNGDLVRTLIQSGVITTCHDVSDGGIAVAVAEMAIAGRRGAALVSPDDLPPHAFWFGEDQARYILATSSDGVDILSAAQEAGVSATLLGQVGGTTLTLDQEPPISLSDLRAAHDDWFPAYMAGGHNGESA